MPPPRTALLSIPANPNVQQVIFGGQKGAAQVQAPPPADAPSWLSSLEGPPQYGPGMAMADAQRLENQGQDPQQIFQTTGWYHAPDGQWKWVLSDKGASLNTSRFNPGKPDEDGNPTLTLRYSSNQTLPQVLNHPSLYQVYPKLATAQVKRLPDQLDNGDLIADYDPDENTVRLSSNRTPTELTSTLLHELQHGVQGIEGFAEGGGSKQFLPSYFYDRAAPAMKAWNNVRDQLIAQEDNTLVSPWVLRDALEKKAAGTNQPVDDAYIKTATAKLSPQLYNEFSQAVSDLQPITQMQNDAYQQYRDLAGETEARQVQAQYELKNWDYPPTTLPGFVPANQQILSYPSHQANWTYTPTGTQYDMNAPGTTVTPPPSDTTPSNMNASNTTVAPPPSDTTPPTAIQSIVPPQYDPNNWTTVEPGGPY